MTLPDGLPPLRCSAGGDCWDPDSWPECDCAACMVMLDELLWALFGWLWLLGGRTELETWTPDDTRIAGVDDDELAEWCDDCGQLLLEGGWLVGLDSQLCESCYAIYESERGMV